MLGVVFGVGSVIAMLAVGTGASREAQEQIRRLGSQNIIIHSVQPQQDQTTERVRMSIYGLTYDDDARIRETIPFVSRTVPAKLIPQEARVGGRQMELRVVGTTPGWFELVERELLAGRRLQESDMVRSANVTVLTERSARRLLATEQVLGESVRIGSNYYQVVGIIRSETGGTAGGVQTPDQEVDAYIPITTARERFGDIVVRRREGSTERSLVELHQLVVEVDAIENVQAAATAIEHMLRRFHSREDYRVSVPLALLRQAEATQRTFNIVLGSIAGISLLVGGIGIMNIMLASVTERTREIGIRRAIGAKRSQIVGQFLIETIVLSSTGGLIGIAVGVTIPQVIEYFAGMPTVVPLYAVVLSLGISVAVGVIFGIYPAMRAAKLDPIVALRYD
ncbi:MAG: FtsX-like permease family protein [Puniceicoccaceae bacterium]|nr:MAG: FtsX-like permease family protein [Puniceicoccaceae bacterium]